MATDHMMLEPAQPAMPLSMQMLLLTDSGQVLGIPVVGNLYYEYFITMYENTN